ncbi:SDR family oxidoreductase [Ochrobactrum teleogrylli]|uniref:SDR family oxidoreductase n=1 Tax=Ochrobactrum teleogrylli TaxID=2479765 RepID=A0ABD5K1W4_9HYPH
MSGRNALIVGVTGIVGRNLAEELLSDGWVVYGLARRPESAPAGVISLKADLNHSEEVRAALAKVPVTHLFQAAWTPAATEQEASDVNARHLDTVLDAIRAGAGRLQHVVLVTGVKHYLGPFKDFGCYLPETPFREGTPRLPLENFYYAQEDRLFSSAERDGFTWSVHRPNAIVGFAVGALMNTGVTLACYATICRETGRPFAFTGAEEQWNMLTEVSDARLIAKQLAWAAVTPAAQNMAFNTGNGDVFRWRRMWRVIADYFGLQVAPYEGIQQSLQELMADAGPIWRDIALRNGLVEPDINRLATWWHSDADFGRKVECISDMTRSRKAGFLEYQSSDETFIDLFRRLQVERIVPAY